MWERCVAAEVILLVVLPVLLIVAAGFDLASFTIPNAVTVSVAAVFPVFALVSGMPLPVFGLHVAAGCVGLVVGFGLFALGYVGGGDAKLFAAIVLWVGFADLVGFALATALLGGGLTLVIVMLRGMPMPARLIGLAWLERLHDRKAGIPYGVALAAGLFAVLPQTEVFRLLGAA